MKFPHGVLFQVGGVGGAVFGAGGGDEDVLVGRRRVGVRVGVWWEMEGEAVDAAEECVSVRVHVGARGWRSKSLTTLLSLFQHRCETFSVFARSAANGKELSIMPRHATAFLSIRRRFATTIARVKSITSPTTAGGTENLRRQIFRKLKPAKHSTLCDTTNVSCRRCKLALQRPPHQRRQIRHCHHPRQMQHFRAILFYKSKAKDEPAARLAMGSWANTQYNALRELHKALPKSLGADADDSN